MHENVENCWERSPTSRVVHGFISKEYISIDTSPFGETKSKTTRVYVQSGES